MVQGDGVIVYFIHLLADFILMSNDDKYLVLSMQQAVHKYKYKFTTA